VGFSAFSAQSAALKNWHAGKVPDCQFSLFDVGKAENNEKTLKRLIIKATNAIHKSPYDREINPVSAKTVQSGKDYETSKF